VTPRVIAMTVAAGKVSAIWDVANPDKFTASPLRPGLASPTESGTRHRN
jgi:RNA polymerase sigma-70 factor (ECF subfamily)